MRVDEKYAAGIQKLETVTDEIHRILGQQRAQPAIQDYLQKLRKQAFIEVKAGYVDSGSTAKEGAVAQAAVSQTSADKGNKAEGDSKGKKKRKWLIIR